MTNNTLKSTIESILATNALLVVTLDGTFNSQTGAPVLSARTRPDQRNKFLKDYCEKVSPADVKDAQKALEAQIVETRTATEKALDEGDYAAVIASATRAAELTEQLDQPRMYYRVKPDVDLRTVAEKRAAKKAENEEKRATAKAAKEAKIAEKMAAKAAASQNEAKPVEQPVASPATEQHSAKKGGRK